MLMIPGRRVRVPRVGRPGVVLVVAALLVGGCGSGVATPAGITLAPTATPAPSPSPSPAYADTLRIGWDPGIGSNGFPYAEMGYRGATESGFSSLVTLGSVVYSRLYRWDPQYDVVPDLADGPCEPQGDGTVIRCRIIETTFHDGTPLTADDVAYSYRLFGRDTFSGGPGVGSWTGSLKEVQVVNPRTVDFVLPSVDPTFLTEVLPVVPILPQHVAEAAYAKFVASTKGLDAAELLKLSAAIDTDLGHDPPVCTTRLDQAAALTKRIGHLLYRQDYSPGGRFDPCSYMWAADVETYWAGTALGSTGLDAVAAAYWCLTIDQWPIGTGPYKIASVGADGIRLEAWAGYHGGVAATRYLDFAPGRGDGSDLVDGTIDIYQDSGFYLGAGLGSAFRATAASRGVQVATSAQTGLYALMFNVRPGRLFADVNLRKALQLCIDLPRDIDAATGGAGTAIYGPIMPGSWAYDPDLPTPSRDVAAARALIEGAGWQLGPDGIYMKDGTRLAATIPARGGAADRVHMADLIAQQARDCGMQLKSDPRTIDELRSTIYMYPHDLPGTKTPFDLYLGAWDFFPEPAEPTGAFISSAITDAKHPNGDSAGHGNFIGFSDPIVDRAFADAMATYDQALRARLYRQIQEELAAQVPYVFLWAITSDDAARATVTTVDGPLDLTAPNWAWQPERMVVASSGP